MAIEKTKLFEQTREQWPLTVFVRSADGVPCFDSKPCLNDLYRAIEAASEPAGEWGAEHEWAKLANWSFHQAFWALAERSGERHIHRDEVTFEMFDTCMRDNLSDDCWDAERLEYEESPLLFH